MRELAKGEASLLRVWVSTLLIAAQLCDAIAFNGFKAGLLSHGQTLWLMQFAHRLAHRAEHILHRQWG